MTQKKEIRLLIPAKTHKLLKKKSEQDCLPISSFVRDLIHQYFNDNEINLHGTKSKKKKGVVSIHMTSKQKTELHQHCEKLGLSMSRGGNFIITNEISNEPNLLPNEIQALEKSTRALNDVGRNLNQQIKINNRMNTDTLNSKLVSDLAKRCSEQKQVVNNLLKAAKDR